MNKGFVALCALALSIRPALAETLSNLQVVQLSQAGLGDDVIIAKIRASDASFQLTADDLIQLKKAGVSSQVISAMLATAPLRPGTAPSTSLDPMQPHAAGLYIVRKDQMDRLDPTATNQAKTGGHIGHAITFGISTLSIKAAIPGETSRIRIQPGIPVFYFFFDEANGLPLGASIWASGTNTIVTSPSQFTLAHLVQKQGRREAQVGSQNLGGSKEGVMDHDRVEFTYDLVRPGVYKAIPKAPLEPGEYGFLFALTNNGTEGALSARIYDFTVERPPERSGLIFVETTTDASSTQATANSAAYPSKNTAMSGTTELRDLPVYKGDLARAYKVIGPVSAILKRETGFNKPISEAIAFEALWKKARAVGADAVIQAELLKPELGVVVYQKAEAHGVAIKFSN